MTYDPNANWTTARALRAQVPVYFVRIDGLNDRDYSTGAVKSPTRTKLQILDTPRGGGVSLDLLAGTRTVQEMTLRLLDLDGEVTALISTEATAAPLPTIINRVAVVYGGYSDLVETDYAILYRGRIADCRMTSDMTGYELTLSDPLYALLSKQIMTNATDEVRDPVTDVVTAAKPVRLTGNVVNLLYSILTGSFLTTGSFPLETVSIDGTGSAAPTGLGIAAADIDATRFQIERNYWHVDDSVTAVFAAPESGREFIEKEFGAVFQMLFVRSGGGKLGIKFVVPSIAPESIIAVTEDHIVAVRSWRRAYEMHLNKFTFKGDYEGDPAAAGGASGQYLTEFDVTATDDATDQSVTGETVEYLAESRLIRSSQDGETMALELAGRRRAMFLKTPAIVELSVTFDRLNIEEGDVVSITHREIPDILTGTRGVSGKLMTVLSIAPDYRNGVLALTLLDSSFKRYGVISDEGLDYMTATTEQRNTYAFIADTDEQMSNGDAGYRMM
jgi:hypothetical protein